MGEWRQVRIGDFLHRVKKPVPLRDDEYYKLVTVRMHHNGVVQRELKKGKLIGSNMYRVKTGQFILSGIDARHGAFGVVPKELDGAIVTNDFWYFNVDESVVSRDFFLWLTTTPLFLDACIKSSEGTTNRRRLQGDKFFNFVFHFPEINEQKSLAKKFNSIDMTFAALKDEFEQQSDYLKQLRQTVLQEAVEGKLTAAWRKQHPMVNGNPQHDAAALLAQIKSEKERLVKEGKIRKEKPIQPISDSDELFELPKGWVWCKLGGDLASVGTGATPQTTDSSYYQNGTVDWVTSSATNQAIVTQTDKKITEKALQETNCKVFPVGTLIVAIYGQGKTRGQITELGIPAATNQACAAIQLHYSNPSHKSYITLCFQKQYEEIRELASGGSQPNLNMEKIKVTVIPLPPLAEQQAIVNRVDSLMTTIGELEKQVAERKEQAQMLMQVVLREAFNGGLESGVCAD
jgi:restriction endonuclease S subunit